MRQKQAITYKLTSGETCREWGWDRSDLIGKTHGQFITPLSGFIAAGEAERDGAGERDRTAPSSSGARASRATYVADGRGGRATRARPADTKLR